MRKNILLVVDDAYAEYMKNKDYLSGLDLFKSKDNVFVLRTFSKMFGLASLRVGWGYGSKKIVDALNVIKPPFNVNGIAQLAAIESLKDKTFINKSKIFFLSTIFGHTSLIWLFTMDFVNLEQYAPSLRERPGHENQSTRGKHHRTEHGASCTKYIT